MDDLRTNKEILHQLEDRIDEINFDRLLNEKLNKIEEKLEKPTMSYGEFLIYLGIILGVACGFMVWMLLT